MSNPGIKVIPSGDIANISPDGQGYSSDFQSPKVTIPYRGNFQVNATGYGIVTTPHPIGYSPVAIAFYRMVDDRWKVFDNTTIGIETNRKDFVIRTYDRGIYLPTIWIDAIIEYKVWLLLDPAQEAVV